LGDPAVLGERYRILAGAALPELDSQGTTACAVEDLHAPSSALFARICLPGAMPRKELLSALRSSREAQILRPVEWGAIPWPPLARRLFCIVFERPSGGALAPAGAALAPMPVGDLLQKVLAPALSTLVHLSRRGITHRAIRPDNLFATGDNSKPVMLGDCVSVPPAFAQPAPYETIESAMTPPLGRGPGTYGDDLYALGATLLALAIGRRPLDGLSAEDVVEAKLAKGSFNALLDGDRVPFGLREVLRGLLADEARERWGFAEVEQFLSGGITKAVRDHWETRMDRPFPFGGKEHRGFRDLAHAFGKDWRGAATTVLDVQFVKWAMRGVSDAEAGERMSTAIRAARIDSAGRPADPKLVSQISAILDPQAPIRYKGVVVMPDGAGPLLAQALMDGNREEAQTIGELLAKGLPNEWLAWSGRDTPENNIRLKPFKQVQQLLRHSGPGYGLERCLYELNPQLPCLSKTVEPYHVDSVPELVPTLDEVVRRTGKLPAVFDRHLAAFIASRVKRNFDRDFAAMEDARADQVMARLGMARLFAWLQKEHGPPSAPHLTAWLAKDLEPVADRISSRTLREQVKRRLAAIADTGDLTSLFNTLNDRTVLDRDQQGRRAAIQQFMLAGREIAELESRDVAETAREAGWRLSATLGAACAVAAVMLVIVT
jgi:hypothetical protein